MKELKTKLEDILVQFETDDLCGFDETIDYIMGSFQSYIKGKEEDITKAIIKSNWHDTDLIAKDIINILIGGEK
jgi:hypothetical protein